MPPADHAAIVAFAKDFSGGDAALVERVRRMAADPPTDIETLGFYGAEDGPPANRLFLATVNLLDGAGKLSSAEDKYTFEIFALWQEAGVIDAATLPPIAKAVFGPLIAGDGPDEGEAQAYRDLVWMHYARATRELEQHIADRGRVLLSIDATDGDTMLFAVVTPDVGDRWRDKALSESAGYRAGVRSPMWDRFWAHLRYSGRGMIADEGREGLPPGTPKRVEAIPFAE